MSIRTFFAIDNENLIVASSPNGAIVGNPIINNSSTPNGTTFQFGGGTFSEITLDDTGGGRNRFNDDRPGDHVITDGGGLVADGNEVEAESIIVLRALDGSGNPTGPEIDVYIFSQNGNFSDVWGFGLSEQLTVGTSYVKVSGSNAGEARYNQLVTCFADGTQIETPTGPVPVEEIRPGQEVWTNGSGPLPVRWTGSAVVPGTGAMAPVVFAPEALGNSSELVVSQQHRIWIESPIAELYFGQSAVLVAAKHLCGLPGVSLRPQPKVRYTHFMFDNHQIVRSNGLLTESFFLAEQSIGTLEDGPRRELQRLFPDLKGGLDRFGGTAAPTLTAKEAVALRAYLAT